MVYARYAERYIVSYIYDQTLTIKRNVITTTINGSALKLFPKKSNLIIFTYTIY